MTNQEKAKKIVKELVLDISDRRGIGDEFDQIDADIKREIRLTWEEKILTILEKELRTTMALLGVTAIDQITKDYVTKVAPAAHSQGPFPHLPKHIRL